VAFFAAPFRIEFIGTLSDLVFELDVLGSACHGRWEFLWGICIHGDAAEANVRLAEEWSQLPKIGAG